MIKYDNMLKNGDGIEMDYESSVFYYKKAAEIGNSIAMNYAYLLNNGKEIEMNKKEAAKYYKLSADKGNSTAIFNYAWMLMNCEGLDGSKKKQLNIIIYQQIKEIVMQ